MTTPWDGSKAMDIAQSEIAALRAEVERWRREYAESFRAELALIVALRAKRAKDHARIDYERRDRTRKAEAKLAQVLEAARVTLATIDQTEIEDEMPGLGAAIRDALACVEQEGK